MVQEWETVSGPWGKALGWFPLQPVGWDFRLCGSSLGGEYVAPKAIGGQVSAAV